MYDTEYLTCRKMSAPQAKKIPELTVSGKSSCPAAGVKYLIKRYGLSDSVIINYKINILVAAPA